MNYYLLTWKPENEDYSCEEYEKMRKDFKVNNFSDTKWRLRSRSVVKGDGLILFRQGKSTGVFGFGHILDGDPVETTENSYYYKIQFNNLRDSSVQPFLTKKTMLDYKIPESLLNSESSGYGKLGEEIVAIFNKLCEEKIKSSLDLLCKQRCTKW